jgi:hypothetical protein
MADPSTEAVIAGSKAFALALLAPLTERVGTRPRIASDPGQALTMCRGTGLVVVEFQGEGSLRAIQDLVVKGPGLRIVAAVPSSHAAAEGSLRALGVDLARWDGSPDLVLAAVGRLLGSAAEPSSEPAATATASPARPAPPRVAPAARAPEIGERAPQPARARPPIGASLFDDLDAEADSPAPAAPVLAAPAAQAFVPGDAPWPGNAPSALEAAEALARGLAGDFDPPGTPLAPVADVVAGLTELERSVLAGAPQPEPQAFDTEPIRRAAVMRVRVAAALALAPAPGAPVDTAAVSAWLAEIDALLAKVNGLAQAAPAELHPAVEQVRNSLVKEAIDFSEAAHGGAAPAETAAAPAPPHAPRPGKARLVSVASAAEVELEVAEQKRRRTLVVAAALCAVAAAGYHGWRYWGARQHAGDDRPRRSGVPLDAEVVEAPSDRVPVVVRSKDGRAFGLDELRRMREEEGLKGNAVRELAPGAVAISKAAAPAAVPASAPAPAPSAGAPSPVPGSAGPAPGSQ